jgi:hypothetical protein
MSVIYRNLESRGEDEKIINNQLIHSNISPVQPIYSEFIIIYYLFLIYSIVFFLVVFLIWQLIKKDMLIKKQDKRIRDLTELLVDLENEVKKEVQNEVELVKKNKIKNLKKEEEKEIDYEILSYSDKSFVVRGNTKKHKDKLKEFGNYNPNLIGGPGWIFSNRHKHNVEKILNNDF